MLFAQFVLLAPYFISLSALAQTEPTGPGQDYGNQAVPQGAGAGTDDTAQQYNEPSTTLVQQDAEQNTQNVTTEVEDLLDGDNAVTYNDVYQGLHTFWGSDIITNLFHNIGHLIGKWITEFINGWVSDAVRFLTALLRVFVLNPNIAVNGLNGNPDDHISRWIRQGADLMYAIAVDLLLLLFILCIWKYWAEAAWRGGGNLMGAIGRLIFTAGLMLAWPTIYAFEIQITNEMIKYIFFNSSDQVMQLDAAMAAAVKGGLLAVTGLIVNATAPVAGQVLGGILGGGAGGLALGTIAGGVAWAGLIVYMILGAILITQLVYILVLKAIQTALLTAQYMFAPIFLVFFATPDTESVTSGFVRSFVEVSLWTFFWVGLLKVMVIVILSDYNPWGKLVLAVGVLQLMIKVPEFMAKAQISPASDFVRAGSIIGGLAGAAKAVGSTLAQRSQQLAGVIGGNTTIGAAPGPEQSKAEKLKGLPNGVSNQDTLGKFNSVSQGGDPNDPNNPNGPNGPKGPKGPEGPELDKDGKPIKPNDKPDADGLVPPDKKKEEDEKKKKEGDATGADATGKTVNTATDPLGTSVTPGTTTGTGPTGINTGSPASKTATIDTSAISNTTSAIVKGAGEAAQSLDNSKGNKGTGTGTESPADRETRAAAEQLAFDFQNEKNLENAGVDEKATGDLAEASVKGKVLDTSTDKGATGKDGSKDDSKRRENEQAQDGQLDKFAGALASQVLPSKGQNKKEAASGKGVETPVNRNINPVDNDDRGEKDVQGELFSAQDLAALSREGVEGAVADAIDSDADGKSIDVDMDQEIADQSKATAPGGLVAGKTVVGKLASKGGNTSGRDIKTSGVVTGKDAQINTAPPKPGSISTNTEGPNAKDASSTQLEQVTSEPHMAVVDPSTGIGTDEEVQGPDLAVSATPASGGSGKGLNLTIDPKALVAGGQGGVKTEVTGSLKTDGVVADNTGTPQIKTDVQGKVLSQGGGGDKIAADIGTPQTLDAGMTADAQGLNTTEDVTMTADGKIVESSGQMRFNFGPSIQTGGKGSGPSIQGDIKADLTTSADGSQTGTVDATLKTDAKIVGEGGKGQSMTVNATETLSSDGAMAFPDGATLTADGKIVEPSGQIRLPFPHVVPGGTKAATTPNTQGINIETVDSGTPSPQDASASAKIALNAPGTGAKAGEQTINVDATSTDTGAVELPAGATITADGKIVEQGGQMRLPFTHVASQVKTGAQDVRMDGNTGNVQDGTGTSTANVRLNASGKPGDVTTNVEGTVIQQDETASPQQVQLTQEAAKQAAHSQPIQVSMAPPSKGVNTGAPQVKLDASGQPATGDNAQMNVSGRVLGSGGAGGGNGSGGPPVDPPDPSEGGTPGPDSPYLNMYNTSNDQKPFATYQQAGYRWIGPRTIAGNIRLAKDTTLGPSTSGEAEVMGNGKGQTFHVRTGRDASEEQIAMQMMTAGYAQYVGSDPVAYDAARSSAMEAGAHKPQNWKERMAAGIMTYNGGSWSQTAAAKQRFQQAMYSQAVQGSQAYVLNQSGNAYTEYLNDRFGPMDEEQQAMGAFIMSNAGSPESAWNWKHIPATESLVQNAIPISGMSRAVASHMNIMRAQPWAKGHRIRGGVAYMNARMAEELPGVSPMSGVATVWAGREAQIMPNEVVDTVGALAHEFGETACQNVAMVNRIATEVGAGKDPGDYTNAYKAMTGMANAGNAVAGRQRVQQIVQGQVIRSGGGAPSMASSVSLGGQTYMNDVPVEVELVDNGAHVEPELPGNLSQIAGAAAVAGGHQQTRASVHVTNTGAGPTSTPPGRKIRLTTTLHDNTPQMEASLGSYNGPSNSGQVVETRVDAELVHSGRSTDYGTLDENELARDAGSFVSQFNDTAQMAYRVVHDLHSAGFSYEQLADPHVAQTALRVYAQDPSMAPAAAIALNKVGAENFSVERTHVVQTMLDTDPDWGQHNIDSKSIYTAEAIMRVTSSIKEQEDSGSSLQGVSPYPTKSFVKQVGLVRAFQARAQEADQGYDQSIVDVIRRKMEQRAKGYDREYSGLEDDNGRTA